MTRKGQFNYKKNRSYFLSKSSEQRVYLQGLKKNISLTGSIHEHTHTHTKYSHPTCFTHTPCSLVQPDQCFHRLSSNSCIQTDLTQPALHCGSIPDKTWGGEDKYSLLYVFKPFTEISTKYVTSTPMIFPYLLIVYNLSNI